MAQHSDFQKNWLQSKGTVNPLSFVQMVKSKQNTYDSQQHMIKSNTY